MRYYFDMIETAELIADEIGIEFDNDTAAVAEAVRSLADWAHDTSNEPNSRAFTILVRDEEHEVARLKARLEIEITPPLAGTA